nr:type II toxin-antitoxin system ParD family antitoxin [methanotrophic endosymbiont of Bathymodiolus puteoserpentis (Logatchev)]
MMPRNTSVTLGDHFDRFVSDKVAEGRFHSVSEAVRAGLRKLEDDELKLQALREKLQAGEDSPIVEDFQVNNFINLLHEKNVS